MKTFDVVIVGGAMSGSVLALALSSFSQHKMQIAIIEKSAPDFAQQGGFDARSIALAYGSLQKFRQIQPLTGQNLADILAEISTPIRTIHVSDQGHFGKTCLTAEEAKLPQLGGVVELATFGKKLAQLIKQQPNIQLFCPNSVSELQRTQSHCELRLTNGETLITPLIVAADGIQSPLAQQCGVETMQLRDYHQSAIIANVAISEPHQGQAFERFTSQGPLALLPLSEKRMSLVWCVTEPQQWQSLSENEMLTRLQTAFGWQLGKFVRLSNRFVYPLTSQKAKSHIHHRLALVGNAAQLLHPVAGQGFNLGLRDLFSLAQLVADAFLNQQDLGEYRLLCEYEKQRQADQQQMINRTDRLISLFCNEILPLEIARNLSLIGLSHNQFARQQIANMALGW